MAISMARGLTAKALRRIRLLIISMGDCPVVWRGFPLFILLFRT